MTEQIINPVRQARKRIMKNFNLKSGKQYRKWIKKERLEGKKKK